MTYIEEHETEGGFMPYNLEDEIDRKIKEARAEVKKECKARHSDYKFYLPKVYKKG